MAGPLGSITNPLPYPASGGIFDTVLDAATGLVVSRSRDDGQYYADYSRQGEDTIRYNLDLAARSAAANNLDYVPGLVQSTGDYSYSPVRISPLDILQGLAGLGVSGSQSAQSGQLVPQQVSPVQSVIHQPVQPEQIIPQQTSPGEGFTSSKLESYIVIGIMFMLVSSIVSLFRR
jgi:hypothetical protein